jgi:hypothetical protein
MLCATYESEDLIYYYIPFINLSKLKNIKVINLILIKEIIKIYRNKLKNIEINK